MGAIKDALRKVLTEEAQRTGRDIRFLDTPTKVIETAKQAKKHDMERVEKPAPRKYGEIVYKHNPNTYKESDLLFLYVFDSENQKVVGYISFGEHSIHVCRGCGFGEYNVWREGCHLTAYGKNAKCLTEATEYFERVFADSRYKFIITQKGREQANEIMKIQTKK